MATFSIAILAKETDAVLLRFAAHHRAIGAEHIHIFHDGPAEDGMVSSACRARLAEWGVGLTFCDAAFWADHPDVSRTDLHARQELIYRLAHETCASDWLFLCDADEFLIDHMPVGAFLDGVPDGADSVGILPAEAVWGPGDDIDVPFGATWFRRAFAKGEGDGVGLRSLFAQRGLLGHTSGKQFLRCGAEVDRIELHFSFHEDRKITQRPMRLGLPQRGVELAHYDAIGFERWHAKFSRRIDTEDKALMARRHRRRQLQHRVFALCRRAGPWAERSLFRRMYGLTAAQAHRLEARDLAFRMPLFDPIAPDLAPAPAPRPEASAALPETG
jgi:hypothetical protein